MTYKREKESIDPERQRQIQEGRARSRGDGPDLQKKPQRPQRPQRPTKSPYRSPKPRPPQFVTPFRAQSVGEKVAIALDVQNLYHGSRLLYKSKIAYREFIDKMLNGRRLIRSMAYVTTAGRSQSSFLGLLRNIGCDVKEKRINVVNSSHTCTCGRQFSGSRQAVELDGLWKCDWGVEITIDALALAPKIDTFILASGDGHFSYLLEALKMAGVRTEVVSFQENTSGILMKAADHYNDIGPDMMMEQPKEPEPKLEPEPEPEPKPDEEEEEYYEEDEEEEEYYEEDEED